MNTQEEAEEIKRILQDIDAIVIRTSQLSLGDARSRARCCLQDASSNLEGLYCRLQDGINPEPAVLAKQYTGGLLPCRVWEPSQFLPLRVMIPANPCPTAEPAPETPPPGVPNTPNCGWGG